MSSVNKAIIIGRLGKDPETKYTQGGDAVCNLSVATSETWKDKSGEKQEKTEWHRVTAFGRTAEIAGEYLKKGSLAYFEGRIQTRKWTDKEGNDKYTTEIICDKLQLLEKKQSGGNEEQESKPAARKPAPTKADEQIDDDIPF